MPEDHRAVQTSLVTARRERRGLQGRIDAARQQASVLLGDQTSEYLGREPESEQLLFEAERNLVAGERRIIQLKAHLDHLSKVLQLLERK